MSFAVAALIELSKFRLSTIANQLVSVLENVSKVSIAQNSDGLSSNPVSIYSHIFCLPCSHLLCLLTTMFRTMFFNPSFSYYECFQLVCNIIGSRAERAHLSWKTPTTLGWTTMRDLCLVMRIMVVKTDKINQTDFHQC